MTTWVLMRGLMRDARHWEGFADRLRKSGQQVLTPDLPGNGRLCDINSPTEISEYCDAVWAQIQPRLNPYKGKTLALIGLSMGGMVALELAKRHPDAVSQVVVLNSSAADLSPWYRRFQLLPLFRAFVGALGVLVVNRQKALAMPEAVVLQYTSLQHGDDTSLIARWSRLRRDRHTSLLNGLRQLYACARFRAPLLHSVPVTVICAQTDQLAHYSCSRALALHYHGQLHTLEACGHDISLDVPDALAAVLAEVVVSS